MRGARAVVPRVQRFLAVFPSLQLGLDMASARGLTTQGDFSSGDTINNKYKYNSILLLYLLNSLPH